MQDYEYRVVPAPRQGIKVKGVRSDEGRFAAAVEGEMNRMAAQGWDYVRSDTLPSEVRQGWFGGRATVSRTLLVFRRARAEARPAMPTALPGAMPVAVAVPPASPAPFAGSAVAGVAPAVAPLVAPPRLVIAEGAAEGPPVGRREPRLVAE